ncbi:ATP-binding protein [Limnobacter sp.]|uniref:ATP-binding protein n=1 Tax=Limnobacter sp. TaxID=2003368 RepID=UPI0025901D07|nr:ATP-binding protein [Limnobacter sp.]
MGKLFWKFFFGFWLCLILAAGATGAVLYLLREKPHSTDLAEGPRAQFLLETAQEIIEGKGPKALERVLVKGRSRTGQTMPIFAVSQDGKELLGRGIPDNINERIKNLGTEKSDEDGIIQVTAVDGSQWVLFIPKPPRVPQKRIHKDPEKALEPPLPPFPTLGVVVAMLASVLFAGGLAYNFSSPLRKLKRAFEQAGRGELGIRIAPDSPRKDEMGELLSGFDAMAEQIERHIKQHQTLLHDVSHELRSPLARLNMATGLARQSPANLEKSLSRIELEAERLDRLIGELLNLSRLETGINSGSFSTHNVIDLLNAVIDDAQFEAQNCNRRVVVNCALQKWLSRCDPEALQGAFENLLRNALRYTPEGSAVTVDCYPDNQQRLQIHIRDEGPGVPADAIDKLFTPFFKIGPLAGNGLGLAIVKKTVEVHKGTLQTTNLQPHGLKISLSLPKLS